MVLNRKRSKPQPRSVDDEGRVYATSADTPRVIARIDVQAGELSIGRKTHGTWVERSLHVTEIVSLLDPDGTTYRAI